MQDSLRKKSTNGKQEKDSILERFFQNHTLQMRPDNEITALEW